MNTERYSRQHVSPCGDEEKEKYPRSMSYSSSFHSFMIHDEGNERVSILEDRNLSTLEGDRARGDPRRLQRTIDLTRIAADRANKSVSWGSILSTCLIIYLSADAIILPRHKRGCGVSLADDHARNQSLRSVNHPSCVHAESVHTPKTAHEETKRDVHTCVARDSDTDQTFIRVPVRSHRLRTEQALGRATRKF